ncbi:hypothetical protein D1AOALGA4SA_10574, partial [Olavius algarvensis Delta 1 endosymbiont]
AYQAKSRPSQTEAKGSRRQGWYSNVRLKEAGGKSA